MDRLPVQALDELLDLVPPDKSMFIAKLVSARERLVICQEQYDEERRAPPWLPFMTSVMKYWGVVTLMSAYVIRTVRTGDSVRKASMRAAVMTHEDLIDEAGLPEFRYQTKTGYAPEGKRHE